MYAGPRQAPSSTAELLGATGAAIIDRVNGVAWPRREGVPAASVELLPGDVVLQVSCHGLHATPIGSVAPAGGLPPRGTSEAKLLPGYTDGGVTVTASVRERLEAGVTYRVVPDDRDCGIRLEKLDAGKTVAP